VGRQVAYIAQQALNGLQTGVVYALLGCGFVMAYGVSGRIDLSFGALVMWGGQTLILAAIALAPLFLPAPMMFACAIALALIGNAALGWAMARQVTVPMAGRGGLAPLVATLGFLIALSEAARLRADSRDVWLPPVLAGAYDVFGVTVRQMQIVNLAVSASAVALLAWLILRTRFGRAWRAISDDPVMARLSGVDLRRTGALAGALAAACAGLSGVMIAFLYGNIDFGMGLMMGAKVLFVCALGSLRSVPRSVAGGIALGLLEAMWSAWLPLEWRDVAVFCALILLAAIRLPDRDALS